MVQGVRSGGVNAVGSGLSTAVGGAIGCLLGSEAGSWGGDKLFGSTDRLPAPNAVSKELNAARTDNVQVTLAPSIQITGVNPADAQQVVNQVIQALQFQCMPMLTDSLGIRRNAALLNQRLMRWSHTDAAGIETDRLELTLNIEGLDGLPTLNGKIDLRVGYLESGLVEKGEFVVTHRTPVLFPMRLMIVATAAPFSVVDATGYRQRRSASYGPTTLGTLFRQLVSRHGYSPRVAPALEGIAIEHIDQSNESDMAFISRLARLYSAVTKPFNELYVLAEAGRVKSLSGQLLPEVKLSVTNDNRPGEQSFITAKLDEKSRSKYEGCRASWWDASAGKQRVVQMGNAPFKTLRQRYQNEAEARAVAEGELRRVGRENLKLLIDCPGNPLLAAEGLLVLDASWPPYMQGLCR